MPRGKVSGHHASPSCLLVDRGNVREVWSALGRSGKIPSLDKFLERYFREHKKFGKRDRAFVRSQVYSVIRNAEALLAAIVGLREPLPTAPHAVLEEILSVPWSQIVTGSQALLRDVAVNSSQQGVHEDDFLRFGVPRFYLPHLERRKLASNWTDADALRFLEANAQEAELWIRPDLRSLKRIDLFRELEDFGAKVVREAQGSVALCLDAPNSLYHSKAFLAGGFEIQDPASQAIGWHAWEAIADLERPNVWDVCAGAGGKTLQLAEAMRNRGGIYATDIRASALMELKRRAKRHDLQNIRTKLWDGHQVPDLPSIVKKQGGYDLVLVDAPCSSSGTWRRNPEARYRMDRETLNKLSTLQGGILQKVASSVRPGGALVYATCSWICEENEDVVAHFLVNNSDFSVEETRFHNRDFSGCDWMFSAKFVRRTD